MPPGDVDALLNAAKAKALTAKKVQGSDAPANAVQTPTPGATLAAAWGGAAEPASTAPAIWQPTPCDTSRLSAPPPPKATKPPRRAIAATLAAGPAALTAAAALLGGVASPPGADAAPAPRPLSDLLPSYAGPLFEREYRLPLPASFAWPEITHFAFHEHTGAFRESWAVERGKVSCSVADRPTMCPPSANCYHFIGDCYVFLQSCPLVVRMSTSHVTCGKANWASWAWWPGRILDGSMLESAEELLYYISIGDRSANEQPHTAHEQTIGPPSFVMNSHEHGGPSKTWLIWSRHLAPVPPTNLLPVEARYETMSGAKGDADARMLARSSSWPPMVSAATSVWDVDAPAPADGGRPAHEPCPQYFEWRRALHHNFGIFAAGYAPTLPHSVLLDEQRSARAIVLMPIAPSAAGPCFLVPLASTAACFGVLSSCGSSLKQQAEHAAAFLSLGIETQYITTVPNGDYVVAVPWDLPPARTLDTCEARVAAADSSAAAWCTSSSLQGTALYALAMMAVQRVLAMGVPSTHSDLVVGIWNRAKPAVLRQRARHWGQRVDDPDAAGVWARFLRDDALRGVDFARHIAALDDGDGAMLRVAASVRTAADYADELPMPAQGLPSFADAMLLRVAVPQRPLPLIKEWLHLLPEQVVPPGFVPLRLQDAVRMWGIRMMVNSRNANMKYDAYCFEHGRAPPPSEGLRRPSTFTLGRGAGMLIPHADGVGSYNALDIIHERRDDGLFVPMRFDKKKNRKWVFDVISAFLGSITDRMILSFLFHGVCWMIDAPRQLRFSRNLERYDAHAVGLAMAVQKLASNDYVDIIPICKVVDGLTVDGANPQLYLFQYDVPVGGIPKDDGTVRPVGDMTSPHDGHRERNSFKGEPDGPVVISANDLSGPKGKPPEGYVGPLPFPDPEIKPRPRDKYTAGAVLSHYCHLGDTYMVTHDDDMRHMFFQFFMREEDLPVNVWYIIARVAGVLWYVAVRNRTMNQGARNASKIACEFAEEWLDAWRTEMDAYVADPWLPQQTAQLRRAYAERVELLGHAQARPFWAAVYTDNFDFSFVGPSLGAYGIYKWKAMNAAANIWLQADCQVGTISDWIGGRSVVTAGIGCVPPSKRERALVNSREALAGTLSRERYHSNNSFLAHVNDICDWPPGSLDGIAGPLAAPGFDTDPIRMTPLATVKYEAAIELLQSRPLASFWSGVTDAYQQWSGTGATTGALIRVHATDCCTEPEPCEGQPRPQPHIAGVVNGIFWRFKLTGEWLERHITLTESCGPAISALLTVPLFPSDINVLATDASAGAAAGTWHAHSANLQSMQAALAAEPIYQEVSDSVWLLHWKGWGNGLSDALSRDNLVLARRLAHAFGITLREIEVSDTVRRFMNNVLVATREPNAERRANQSVDASSAHGTSVNLGLRAQPVSAADYPMAQTWAASLARRWNKLMHIMYGNSAPLGEVSEPPSPFVPSGAPPPPSPCAAPSSAAAPPSASHSVPGRRPSSPPTPTRASPYAPALRSVHDSPSAASMAVPEHPGAQPASHLAAILKDDDPASHLHCVRPGSPQPLTAGAARRASHTRLADELADNTSPDAICPDDPERLRAMIVGAGVTRDAGIAHGSKGADENGFKWVREFAQGMGPTVRWMRPFAHTAVNVLNEVWFTVLALCHICLHIAPSAKRKARGFTVGQPTSGLQAIYGWRRVMRDCGRHLCDMTEVLRVLKGLCLQYRAAYGPEAFLKQQAMVFSLDMLHAISLACTAYRVPGFSAAWHDAWAAKHAHLASTGTRKDEVIRLLRAHFVWVGADFQPLPSTQEVVSSRKDGDYLRGSSTESKCDPLNLHWGHHKQWFRLDSSNPMSFALHWRNYELKHPCPAALRSSWPAFSPSGDHVFFTHASSANAHRQLVTYAIGEADAAPRTIHSYRATLASALIKARAEGRSDIADGIIQALERWRSVEAMRNYEHMAPSTYADYVSIGVSTDAGHAASGQMPQIEPADSLAALDATVQNLTADLNRAEGGALSDAAERAGSAAQAQRTRQAPAHPPPRAVDAVPQPETFDIGEQRSVVALGPDTWGLVGTTIEVENALWDAGATGTTSCLVAGFIGKRCFSGSTTQHAAYVVTAIDDNHHYALRASYLATRVADAALRRRLRKAPPPRAASQ